MISTLRTSFESIASAGLQCARSVSITNQCNQKEAIRHIGPMAQDFYAAFGLDQTDKGINTVDMDGVTLAGVKALDLRTEAQAARIDALEEQVRMRDEEIDSLRERLDRLERLLTRDGARERP